MREAIGVRIFTYRCRIMNNPPMIDPLRTTVGVCIPTFRRNGRLRALLDDLARQDRPPDQVIVVDNDATGAARTVVEECRGARPPFAIDYDVQPVPNISLTRNRTVQLAHTQWLAFIDDDERAPPEWIGRLLHAANDHRADVILSPVLPQVPPTAALWIRRGRFYDFPRQPEGAPVPTNCMRFGNVLLRAALLREEPGPFDPRFGLTAGEDIDLLARLARKGARIIWTETAPVFEPIEEKRLALRWLLRRALGGGQGFARYAIAGGFGPLGPLGRWGFFLRALAQMLAAFALAVLALPFGRHYAVQWLIKAAANAGKLSALWGGRHEIYGRAP